MRKIFVFATVLASLLLPSAALAAERFTPIFAHSIAPARPVVTTDGKKHLAYELVITNYSGAPAEIERINRFAGKRKLAPVPKARILELMKPFASATGTNVLGPGQSGIILMDLALRRGAKLPARISHQFVVAASNQPLKLGRK